MVEVVTLVDEQKLTGTTNAVFMLTRTVVVMLMASGAARCSGTVAIRGHGGDGGGGSGGSGGSGSGSGSGDLDVSSAWQIVIL